MGQVLRLRNGSIIVGQDITDAAQAVEDGYCVGCGRRAINPARPLFTILSGRYAIVPHANDRTCLIELKPPEYVSTYSISYLIFPRCESGQCDICPGKLDYLPGVAYCVHDCHIADG